MVAKPGTRFESRAGFGPVALAFVCLTSACGGSSGDAAADSQAPGEPAVVSSEVRNACEILPASIVQEVVGVPVRDSLALSMNNESAGTNLSQCNYATDANPAAVSFMLRKSAPGETGERASQGVRQTMQESGAPVEDVSGLGSIAFFSANQLHVFLGNDWHLVVTPQVAAGLSQARALAERAIQQL